jgi:hypothetical protein
MAQNILHHMALENLKNKNLALFNEYNLLFDGLVKLMRQVFEKNEELRKLSNLSQLYNMETKQAFIEMLIHYKSNTYRKHFYIQKNQTFMLGLHGEGAEFTTAKDCLNQIAKDLKSESLIN